MITLHLSAIFFFLFLETFSNYDTYNYAEYTIIFDRTHIILWAYVFLRITDVDYKISLCI